ncbi:MAG: hypothetical protein RPU64_04125 [Candidatus Sedimenticola sp. (ex Thyasira tokunagai)]
MKAATPLKAAALRVLARSRALKQPPKPKPMKRGQSQAKNEVSIYTSLAESPSKEMRIYRYRITDNPVRWNTMIAPGCDAEEARRSLINIYGAARLLEVVEQDRGTQHS